MVYESSSSLPQILQEDVLAPARYLETIRGKTLSPEQKLVLAVLENAIENFQKHFGGRTVRAQKRFSEAEEWLIKEKDTYGEGIFSFENACEMLRLNPEYVRKGIRNWTRKQYQSRPLRGVKQGKAA